MDKVQLTESNIRQNLTNLEAMLEEERSNPDFEQLVTTGLRTIRNQIVCYGIHIGFRTLQKRFVEIESKVRTKLGKNIQYEVQKGSKIYWGIPAPGLSLLKCIFELDKLYLSRMYREPSTRQRKLILQWDFDREGRINLVSMSDFELTRGFPVEKINAYLPTESCQQVKSDGIFRYHPLLKHINPEFAYRNTREQAGLLLHYGHLAIKDIIDGIINNTTKSPKLKQGEHSFVELPDDMIPLSLLQRSARHSPYISQFSDSTGRFMVVY